jgi:hypothetical protein
MKGWTKGMFPPDAQFPAGYHFGDDNVRDALCAVFARAACAGAHFCGIV